MNTETLAARLLALDEPNWPLFLENHADALGPAIVDHLGQLAEQLRLERPQDALRAARAMASVAVVRGDEPARAQALSLSGRILIHLNRYRESLEAYGEARAILARCQDPDGEIKIARLAIGEIAALKNLGEYERAMTIAQDTEEVLVRRGLSWYRAILDMNVGSILRLTGQYEQALATYERGRQSFLLAGDRLEAARMEVNLAQLFINMDRIGEATRLLETAEAVFVEAGKVLPAARTALNRGILLNLQGRYRPALQAFGQAKRQFEALGVEKEGATVDLFSSDVYLALNLLPEALDRAREAAETFAELAMPRYVALARANQAAAQRGLGNLTEADRLFNQARDAFSEQGAAIDSARVDLERAILLHQQGRAEQAQRLALAVYEQFTALSLPLRSAQAQLTIANCQLALGEEEGATGWYHTVLKTAQAKKIAPLAYRAHFGLGQVAERQGRHELALDHYRAAVVQIESIQQELLADELQAGFLDDKLDVYEALVRLLLENEQVEDAFYAAERAKSGVLLDFLARGLELQVEGPNQELLARLAEFKALWHKQYRQIDGASLSAEIGDMLRTSANKTGDSAWLALHQIERQIKRVLRQLQMRGHRYGRLAGREQPTLADLQDSLAADTVLLAYYAVEDDVIAFLVSRDGIQVRPDLGCSLRVVNQLLAVLDLLLKSAGSLPPAYVAEVLEPQTMRKLKRLYQMLLAPLATDIAPFRRLIVVPHGALHTLPFHALHDGQRYLIEDFEMQYLPGAGLLTLCQEQAKMRHEMPPLVMGYSAGGRLPGAMDEVDAVARQFDQPLLFREDEATLEHLRTYADRCGLLHLATHATFRSDNPLFSFLQLAGSRLSLVDVYNLDLRQTSLVTLSACESGRHRPWGSDLVGLSKGFFHAGASALLASLWQVADSSTAQLMSDFYRRLASGQSKVAALQAAQLALMESHPHPFYWAPFVLIGD